MTKREHILLQIKQIADKNYPDSEIILYGSQARGDANAHSDWDILILLSQEKVSFDTETKIMDDYYELELQTGEVIAPLVYSKKDWDKQYKNSPLNINIKKDGVKIK